MMMGLPKLLLIIHLAFTVRGQTLTRHKGQDTSTVQYSVNQEWNADGYKSLCQPQMGCRCDESVSVDCSNLQIQELPSNIIFPKQISLVGFQHNRIKSIVQTTFFHSPGVETIDFSNNSLQLIQASSFVAFENLSELRLSNNKLPHLFGMIFDGLNNLKILDLSHNNITVINSIIFRPCPLLMELKLHYNPLTSLHANCFEYLPNLARLNLKDTKLKKLPFNIFLNNPLLSYLSLANNPFYDIPTNALSMATHLKSLDFSNTLILEIKPHAFRGLDNLTVLNLDNQRVMLTIEKHAFSGLHRLNTLHCSYNPNLGYIHSAAFSNKRFEGPRLLQLHIRDNGLKTLPSNLLPWKSVEYVDLRGNPWMCDCRLKWVISEGITRNDLEGIRCASPKRHSGHEIISLSEDDFTCEPLINKTELFVLLILLSSFFVITLAVFLYLVCRHSVCLMVRARLQHRYVEMLPKKDQDELEWDYTADP